MYTAIQFFNPTILRYLFKAIKELSIDINWAAPEYNSSTEIVPVAAD